MKPPGRSSLRKLKGTSWDVLLDYFSTYDVEKGESTEYMYGVRHSTGVLTIWTQAGWRGNWWVARVTPFKKGEGLVQLFIQLGETPPDREWSEEKVEQHLRDLHSRLLKEPAL